MYGKRHGKGAYTYHDGGKYEGEWVDDKVRNKAPRSHRLALDPDAASCPCSPRGFNPWRPRLCRSTARACASTPSATRCAQCPLPHHHGRLCYLLNLGRLCVQYVGEWSDGKINGYGKLFYVDGARRPPAAPPPSRRASLPRPRLAPPAS